MRVRSPVEPPVCDAPSPEGLDLVQHFRSSEKVPPRPREDLQARAALPQSHLRGGTRFGSVHGPPWRSRDHGESTRAPLTLDYSGRRTRDVDLRHVDTTAGPRRLKGAGSLGRPRGPVTSRDLERAETRGERYLARPLPRHSRP